MEKKMNDKGFSLVELIIVIAIMAVLIGILAPQYLKYVNNSKVSADITNAQEIATAFNVAMADGNTMAASYVGAGGASCNYSGVNMTAWPQPKYSKTYSWVVRVTENGVSEITLGGTHIYPNPETSNGYYKFHK